MHTQRSRLDTASWRLAVCIGLAFAILAGLMSLGAPTASALSNNPAECHNPRNAGSVWGSTASNGETNTAVMRFDPTCDQVWVKITQKVAEDNRVYIVGYTCSEAKASCRGDSQGLKLRQGNRYSYSVSLSDHAAFRLCWSPKVTTGPFTLCTPAITLGSSSSAPSTKKPTSSASSSSSTASPSSTTKNGTVTFVEDPNHPNKVSGTITVNGNTYSYKSGTSSLWSLPRGTYDVQMRPRHGKDNVVTSEEGARSLRLNHPSMRVPDSQHPKGVFGYHFWLTETGRSSKGTAHDSRTGKTRTYLLIHPDGGAPGTAGCIGIQGGAATQRRFYNDMMEEIRRNGGTFRVTVG